MAFIFGPRKRRRALEAEVIDLKDEVDFLRARLMHSRSRLVKYEVENRAKAWALRNELHAVNNHVEALLRGRQ